MHDNEAIQMMARVSEEITSLRREIDRLRPKAEAYDAMLAILRLLPVPSRGMGEDLTWVLNKRIEELKKKQAEAIKEEIITANAKELLKTANADAMAGIRPAPATEAGAADEPQTDKNKMLIELARKAAAGKP
jgi:hypothetical protein